MNVTLTQSVQTTGLVTNINVLIHVTMACLVERMLSAHQQATEQFANVQLDGEEILLLNASNVRILAFFCSNNSL